MNRELVLLYWGIGKESLVRQQQEGWGDEAIVQEPLAQLAWYHTLTILEKGKTREERLWYGEQNADSPKGRG